MYTSIDLTIYKGQSLSAKLTTYIEAHRDKTKKSGLIQPFYKIGATQFGQICKLKALNDAMNIYCSKYYGDCTPLHKYGVFSNSLRQMAKKNGSVVGEVYSIEMLRKIIQDAGFVSTAFSTTNVDEYIEVLQNYLDINQSSIVFFDLDQSYERHGFPYIGDGKNEHACTVIGYYKTHCDETRFIISQWDKYYDFNGMELALSACHSLSDNRKVETFSKRRDIQSKKTYWQLTSIECSPDESVSIPHVPLRTALPMKAGEHSLKGTIVSIIGFQPAYNYSCSLNK